MLYEVITILLAQALPMLGERALWFSDEVRYAAAFENTLRGHWLSYNFV